MTTQTGPTTDTTTDTPPRRRRCIPVSLRMFVAMLAVLGFVCAWRGATGYQQLSAIRHIEGLGGKVATTPCKPDWLRHNIGSEWTKLFDVVESVELAGTDCTDADLAFVALLRPKRLDLGREMIGYVSRGPEHYKAFIPLHAVYLEGCPPITDAGLANLSRMTSLQHLDLNGSQISDAGLEHAGKLVRLHNLDLSNTQVTDAGLASLRPLQSLRELSLRGTQITGAGLVHLRTLPNLERLDLRLTRVGDPELSHLVGLTGLKALGLNGTQVTDSSLPNLKSFVNLEFADATQVTATGWTELVRSLPKLFNRRHELEQKIVELESQPEYNGRTQMLRVLRKQLALQKQLELEKQLALEE
ncbi:MAG: hypothetical protein HY290_08650 [Planctomycetia bacterium]|nr:hypothetical protein [Planctomycetia bacterium]